MNRRTCPVIHSYIDLTANGEPVDLSAEFTGDGKRQRIGTLGKLNKNYEMAAKGALDEWFRSGEKEVPMYVEHFQKTLPYGKWTGFELENGKDVYAVPHINPDTSLGADLLSALKNKDIRGISWTLRARTYKYGESWTYLKRKINGEEYDVLTILDGLLMEVSAVYRPADSAARFTARRNENLVSAAIKAASKREAAERKAAQTLIRGIFK